MGGMACHLGPIWPCLSGPIAGHPAGRCPPAASVLVDVDLVVVEVFHQDAGAVGLDFGFAFELDAALFQGSVLPHAVVGFYAEQRQVGGLPAHERSLLAGLGSVEVDAEFLVVRQAHQEPAVVAHLAILSDLEAQLLGVELKRLILAADKQLDQRDPFHEVLSSFSSPGGGAATCGHPGYLLFGRVRALEAGAFNGWAPLFNRHRTPRLPPAACRVYRPGITLKQLEPPLSGPLPW